MKTKSAAEIMASQQKDISVSAFFTKNRHLLGFDNPSKALLIAVKETVDNSLDACEEARILPEIKITITQLSENRHKVYVEDNGPGIIPANVPKVFGKLLYGSKFDKQSVTYDQQIPIRIRNKVELVPIGEFVERYCKEEGEKDISDLNIMIPSFSYNSQKISWKPISRVYRHKNENRLYRIKTETNKTIKITDCHSLFSYDFDKGYPIPIETRKLNIGDHILIPKLIPENFNNSDKLNILKVVKEKDIRGKWIYVYRIPDHVFSFIENSKETIHKKSQGRSRKFFRLWNKSHKKYIDILYDTFVLCKRKKYLNINIVNFLNLEESCRDSVIQTYHHGNITRIPATIKLTNDLLCVFGLYVAEGSCSPRQISFTLHKKETYLAHHILKTLKSVGFNGNVVMHGETSIRVKVFGTLIDTVFKNLCGRGSKNKKIPEIVFNLCKNKQQYFLKGLYYGDGYFGKSLYLTSASKKLIDEVSLLWKFSGINTTKVKPKTFKGLGKSTSICYDLNLSGCDSNKVNFFVYKTSNDPNYSKIPSKMVGCTGCKYLQQSLKKKLPKNILYNVCKFEHSDFWLVKIKEKEEIPYEEFVYDLGIDEDENFLCNDVLCHNSGSRGQQGLGVSATVMYSQITTNKPAIVYSRTGKSKKAYRFEIRIDTKRNEPEYKVEEVDWDVEHGVSVEVEMEGSYRAGKHSVDQYVALTAIANPHVKIIYTDPTGNTQTYERLTNELPPLAKAVKPHPHGVEFGTFSNMITESKYKEAQKFLIKSFSRVSPDVATKACKDSGININENIKKVDVARQETLHKNLQAAKLKAPQTSCIVPIGEDLIKKSMEHGVEAEFFTSVTRKPEVYRGYPFVVEVGLAYGGKLLTDDLCELYRLANRVPLQYQQSDCAITRAVIDTDWRHYKISQSRGALPSGPLVLLVHLASVWVPFTSESKEAIAKYPEIIKEIKLGIQGCARKLAAYLAAKKKGEAAHQRLSYIETFIPHISMSLKEILGLPQNEELQIVNNLVDMLRKSKED